MYMLVNVPTFPMGWLKMKKRQRNINMMIFAADKKRNLTCVWQKGPRGSKRKNTLSPRTLEVENGYMRKVTTIGDTPIFHFHDCGRTGKTGRYQTGTTSVFLRHHTKNLDEMKTFQVVFCQHSPTICCSCHWCSFALHLVGSQWSPLLICSFAPSTARNPPCQCDALENLIHPQKCNKSYFLGGAFNPSEKY